MRGCEMAVLSTCSIAESEAAMVTRMKRLRAGAYYVAAGLAWRAITATPRPWDEELLYAESEC